MRKAAFVVLAASLIFPLLAVWASPPDDAPFRGDLEKPAVLVASGSLASAGDRVTVELPERLRNLPPAVRRPLLKLLEQRPASRRRTVCLAAGKSGDPMCDFGAAVARMKPCLTARDCPAAAAWGQVIGPPGVRLAPQTMTRASLRSSVLLERPEREKD